MELLSRLSDSEMDGLQDLAQRGLVVSGRGAGEVDGGGHAAAAAGGAAAHGTGDEGDAGRVHAGEGEGAASTSGDVDAHGMDDTAREALQEHVYAAHGLFEESIR